MGTGKALLISALVAFATVALVARVPALRRIAGI